MISEIEVREGQEMNRLKLMVSLMKGIEDMFELVPDDSKECDLVFFGTPMKTISKKSFKATFIIEEINTLA